MASERCPVEEFLPAFCGSDCFHCATPEVTFEPQAPLVSANPQADGTGSILCWC